MSLYLSQVLFSLVSPLGVSLLLSVFGIALGLTGKFRRVGWSIVTFAVCWLWFWSMPVTVGLLRAAVVGDNIPKSIQSLPRVQAIVVLGGGVVSSGMDKPVEQPFDLQEAADRVWYGARLYSAGLAPYVVLSGGNARDSNPETSEAAAMAVFLKDLGVPRKAILLEETSTNTAENARFTAEILESRGIDKILLVTSATHMTRAIRYFEAVGLTVIPAPTDYSRYRPLDKQCCLPDPHTLVINSQLMKEFIGKYFWPLIRVVYR